jgi:hypothetical protein
MTDKNEDIFWNTKVIPYAYQLKSDLFLNVDIKYMGIVVSSLILPDVEEVKKGEWYLWGSEMDSEELKIENFKNILDKYDYNIYLFKLKTNPIYHLDFHLAPQNSSLVDKSKDIDLSFNYLNEFDQILSDISSNIVYYFDWDASQNNLYHKMKETLNEINKNLDDTIQISQEIENEINLMYMNFNQINYKKFKDSKEYPFVIQTIKRVYKMDRKKIYQYLDVKKFYDQTGWKKIINKFKYIFYKNIIKQKRSSKTYCIEFIYYIFTKLKIVNAPKRSYHPLRFMKHLILEDLISNVYHLVYDRTL